MKIKKILITLLIISVCILIPISANAAFSSWPGTPSSYEWYEYSTEAGNLIYDPADESPDSVDIISVPNMYPSVFVASDGTNVFFRMRLRGDPRQSNRFSEFDWIIEVAAQDSHGNFVHTATVGLKGGNSGNIYVAPSYGSTPTIVYSNITTSSSVVRVSPTNDGYSQYFLDFQVPISAICQVAGSNGTPRITGSTPVKLFYGTSTNSIHIGKDFMIGDGESFDGLTPVALNDIKGYLAPELTIEKTGPQTVVAGTQIEYLLTARNLGPGNAINAVITDNPPSGIENVEYSLNGGNSWQPWSGSRIQEIFLADPGIIHILIRGDVANNASGTLNNSVVLTSNTSNTVTDNVQTTVLSQADLSVVKEDTTAQVTPGQQINYSISVYNDGPSDATNVIITDSIDTNIIESPEYFDESDSLWKTWSGSLNVGTVQNEHEYVLSLRGNLKATVTEPVANTAQVNSSATDPNITNNTYTITTPLNVSADVSIEKTGPQNAIAGEQIQYQITVKNNSQSVAAQDVEIIDNISSLILDPEFSVDEGSNYNDWTGMYTINSLAANTSAVILIRGTVSSDAQGIITNTTTVYSGTLDTNENNGNATTQTEIEHSSDISVEKVLVTNLQDIVAGRMIEYLITYRNSGPSDAQNVIITDSMPSGIVNVEASRCRSAYFDWTGSYNAGTVVSGGECTILMRGVITSDFEGSISNTASVSSDNYDPNTSNNTATVMAAVHTISDLSLIKTVSAISANPGGSLTYTITLDNLSFSDARDVCIEDILPSGVNFISSLASIGTWNSPYWMIDQFTAGRTATLTIETKVKDNAYGQDIRNSAVVTSITNDPNTANNSSSVLTSTPPPVMGDNDASSYIFLSIFIAAAITIIISFMVKSKLKRYV